MTEPNWQMELARPVVTRSCTLRTLGDVRSYLVALPKTHLEAKRMERLEAELVATSYLPTRDALAALGRNLEEALRRTFRLKS